MQGQVGVSLCQKRERRGRDGRGGRRRCPLPLPPGVSFAVAAAAGQPARGLDNGALEVVRPVV